MTTKAKHTPGPLTVAHYASQDGHGGTSHVSLKYSDKTVARSINQVATDEDSANFVRLALCWNAHDELVAALAAAVERMEAVSERIPVNNRSKGVSKATHVAHMAGHLAQHAKIARAALVKAGVA